MCWTELVKVVDVISERSGEHVPVSAAMLALLVRWLLSVERCRSANSWMWE